MRCGLLQKFEDFCPIDDTNALIAHGVDYSHLTEILKVKYSIENDNSIHIESGIPLAKGKYMRLGNLLDGKLVFSDCYKIYTFDFQNNTKIEYGEGLQPYGYKDGIVYQRNACIYNNDERIIIPHGEYEVVGRPTIYKNKIYYEARASPAPRGWEVWSYDMGTKEQIKIKEEGANPFVYDDKLFYSKWVGSEFKTFCEELK